jgi:short-subunit dehydrogenase
VPLRVFITGASSGLGAALAEYYANRGAVVGLLARRAQPLAALVARFPATAAAYVADVTDSVAVQQAAADFVSRYGPPDVVIANAGVSVGTLSEDADDLAAFRRVMDVNVYGVAASFQPFVAVMRARSSGTLVGIASIAGFRGLPGASAYSASKAAAITYLESLRTELMGSGVAVVTICPGYVRTPMTAANPYRMPFILDAEEAARRFARAIAAKRRLAVIPWPMAIVACVLRLLPGWLYEKLFAHAPRKPRKLPL